MAGSHGSMHSKIILVFLLFNLWTLDGQIYIRIPNTPGVSNMLTYGSQRRISTYNSSLLCKVDFIRMKVKKYFSARISRYPNSTSSFQLSCLTSGGNICPNSGPPRKLNYQTSTGLSILYLNARSVKAFVPLDGNPSCKICKLTILQQLVYRRSYDVVSICETWLNDTVLSSEILTGYNIYRKDRTGKTGGGVLIAVKIDIRSNHRFDLEREQITLVAIELFKDSSKPVILYTFYHPDPGPDDLNLLNHSLQQNSEMACMVLVGDFNLPSIKWSLDESTSTSLGGTVEEEAFSDLMEDNFLRQFIKGPTHIAGNKLDLLLCNFSEVIDHVSTTSPLQNEFPSDHYLVDFFVRLKFKRSKCVRCKMYDYKRADFDDLRSCLQLLPSDMLHSDDVDIYWSWWKDLFLAAVAECVQ